MDADPSPPKRVRQSILELSRDAKRFNVFLRALRDVQKLHGQGKLHGNITTQNISIDKDLNAKLGDAGIAGKLSEPAYWNKELCAGKPPSVSSDIHALGVCLYELCMGQRPFEDEDVEALKHKIKRGKYEKVPLDGPIPKELAFLTQALLEGRCHDVNSILESPAGKMLA